MNEAMTDQKIFGKVRIAIAGIVALGILTLVSSAVFLSSFFSLVGISLIFWGTILFYIVPTKSNLAMLVSAVAGPASANIERILGENEIYQKGLYLSTNYINSNRERFKRLSRYESIGNIVIYVPASANLSPNDNLKLNTAPKSGVYITPPGEALYKIFEQQLGKSFSEITLQEFTTIMPIILTKRLKLAQAVDVQVEKNSVTIEISQSALEKTCQETDKHQQTHKQVGCLLSSALACCLVSVIGKPVTIDSEGRDLTSKVTRINFTYLADN
jgi:hypothetical protein